MLWPKVLLPLLSTPEVGTFLCITRCTDDVSPRVTSVRWDISATFWGSRQVQHWGALVFGGKVLEAGGTPILTRSQELRWHRTSGQGRVTGAAFRCQGAKTTTLAGKDKPPVLIYSFGKVEWALWAEHLGSPSLPSEPELEGQAHVLLDQESPWHPSYKGIPDHPPKCGPLVRWLASLFLLKCRLRNGQAILVTDRLIDRPRG